MGIQTSTINSGQVAGLKNKLINGGFDVWQRLAGTNTITIPTTNDTRHYVADKWWNFFNGSGGVRTISRQVFPTGQTDVPGNPKYFLRFNQSTAGTAATYNVLGQCIEGVQTLAGQQVTVSFYAKAAASTTLPSINLLQIFGSGGSPSVKVNTPVIGSTTVGTTWARYSGTVTLPSISGKILGTGNNDCLQLEIICPNNATFTLDIANVQVEAGPVATSFEDTPVSATLGLCQRYCIKWIYGSRDTQYNFQRAANLTKFYGVLFLPAPMRDWPSATFYQSATWNAISGAVYTCSDRYIGTGVLWGEFYGANAISVAFDMTGYPAGSWDLVTIRSNHNNAADAPYIIFDSDNFSIN